MTTTSGPPFAHDCPDQMRCPICSPAPATHQSWCVWQIHPFMACTCRAPEEEPRDDETGETQAERDACFVPGICHRCAWDSSRGPFVPEFGHRFCAFCAGDLFGQRAPMRPERALVLASDRSRSIPQAVDVEALTSRVSQLEATVAGLTEDRDEGYDAISELRCQAETALTAERAARLSAEQERDALRVALEGIAERSSYPINPYDAFCEAIERATRALAARRVPTSQENAE